jgi:hypothetical protein
MLFRVLVIFMLGVITVKIAILRVEMHEGPSPAVEPPKPAVVHVSRRALAASPLPFDQTLAGAIGLDEDEQISQIELAIHADADVFKATRDRRVVVVVEP